MTSCDGPLERSGFDSPTSRSEGIAEFGEGDVSREEGIGVGAKDTARSRENVTFDHLHVAGQLSARQLSATSNNGE